MVNNFLGIRHLIESLPLLKEKIHHKQVLRALQSITEQAKKKPNTKEAAAELEEKIAELIKSAEESKQNDTEMMPPPPPARKTKKRSRTSKHRSSSEEEDEGVDSDSDTAAATRRTFSLNKNCRYIYFMTNIKSL